MKVKVTNKRGGDKSDAAMLKNSAVACLCRDGQQQIRFLRLSSLLAAIKVS